MKYAESTMQWAHAIAVRTIRFLAARAGGTSSWLDRLYADTVAGQGEGEDLISVAVIALLETANKDNLTRSKAASKAVRAYVYRAGKYATAVAVATEQQAAIENIAAPATPEGVAEITSITNAVAALLPSKHRVALEYVTQVAILDLSVSDIATLYNVPRRTVAYRIAALQAAMVYYVRYN